MDPVSLFVGKAIVVVIGAFLGGTVVYMVHRWWTSRRHR